MNAVARSRTVSFSPCHGGDVAARLEFERQEARRLRRLADVRPSVQSRRPPRPQVFPRTSSHPGSKLPSVASSRATSGCPSPARPAAQLQAEASDVPAPPPRPPPGAGSANIASRPPGVTAVTPRRARSASPRPSSSNHLEAAFLLSPRQRWEDAHHVLRLSASREIAAMREELKEWYFSDDVVEGSSPRVGDAAPAASRYEQLVKQKRRPHRVPPVPAGSGAVAAAAGRPRALSCDRGVDRLKRGGRGSHSPLSQRALLGKLAPYVQSVAAAQAQAAAKSAGERSRRGSKIPPVSADDLAAALKAPAAVHTVHPVSPPVVEPLSFPAVDEAAFARAASKSPNNDGRAGAGDVPPSFQSAQAIQDWLAEAQNRLAGVFEPSQKKDEGDKDPLGAAVMPECEAVAPSVEPANIAAGEPSPAMSANLVSPVGVSGTLPPSAALSVREGCSLVSGTQDGKDDADAMQSSLALSQTLQQPSFQQASPSFVRASIEEDGQLPDDSAWGAASRSASNIHIAAADGQASPEGSRGQHPPSGEASYTEFHDDADGDAASLFSSSQRDPAAPNSPGPYDDLGGEHVQHGAPTSPSSGSLTAQSAAPAPHANEASAEDEDREHDAGGEANDASWASAASGRVEGTSPSASARSLQLASPSHRERAEALNTTSKTYDDDDFEDADDAYDDDFDGDDGDQDASDASGASED